jgi:hypothetical protein
VGCRYFDRGHLTGWGDKRVSLGVESLEVCDDSVCGGEQQRVVNCACGICNVAASNVAENGRSLEVGHRATLRAKGCGSRYIIRIVALEGLVIYDTLKVGNDALSWASGGCQRHSPTPTRAAGTIDTALWDPSGTTARR